MSVVGVTGFASVIILAARPPLAQPLSSIGSHSVSIYLLHWLAMANAAALSPWPVTGLTGVLALAAVGVALPILVRPYLPDLLFALPRRASPRMSRAVNKG